MVGSDGGALSRRRRVWFMSRFLMLSSCLMLLLRYFLLSHLFCIQLSSSTRAICLAFLFSQLLSSWLTSIFLSFSIFLSSLSSLVLQHLYGVSHHIHVRLVDSVRCGGVLDYMPYPRLPDCRFPFPTLRTYLSSYSACIIDLDPYPSLSCLVSAHLSTGYGPRHYAIDDFSRYLLLFFTTAFIFEVNLILFCPTLWPPYHIFVRHRL